jgi:hypothetical protein
MKAKDRVRVIKHNLIQWNDIGKMDYLKTGSHIIKEICEYDEDSYYIMFNNDVKHWVIPKECLVRISEVKIGDFNEIF